MRAVVPRRVHKRARTFGRWLVLSWALLALRPTAASTHEVPPSVVVRAFVRPMGDSVRVLVRVPLEAMRDVEFPLRDAIGVGAVPGALLPRDSAGRGVRTPDAASLDLARADAALHEAAKLWVADAIELFADGARLEAPTIVAARASLPSDRSFATFGDAEQHMASALLSVETDIPWKQVMLDVALVYRAPAGAERFTMRPLLAHLGVRTTTVLHYLPRDGAERVLTYDGDPGLVALDVSRWQAAWQFMQRGVEHIFSGLDHLLFLLCLVIPFRRARPVIALVTAFTVAHSITLVASAAGYAPDALWFPPLIELLIAASIVYMACENILGAKIERRWPMAFAFGLVHGFGFSFALRDTLQFAGAHLAVSLAAFNVGVELGQLTVLAVMLPLLHLAFSKFPERTMATLLSAIVGHQAWHWMTDRLTTLRQFSFTLPEIDATLIATASRAFALLLVLGVVMWGASKHVRRWLGATASATVLLVVVAVLLRPATLLAQSSTRSTRTGVFTAAQAQAGREVFVGSCTGCHTSASHTGPAFLAKWAGRPLAELFGFVSTRMPKANPGSLSEDEYVTVVAYVLKLNGMPAGAKELSADPESLNAIRFDAPVSADVAKPSGSGKSNRTAALSSSRSPQVSLFLSPHVALPRNATESR
jgi:mono/diheme cytochrome c family protein